MRKIHMVFCLSAVLSLVLMGCSEPSVTQAMRGSGTASDPYIVETVEHLINVGNNLSAHYRQEADIDLSGIAEWESLAQDDGNSFIGVYDGNHWTISNMTITQGKAGLFHRLGTNGELRNINLADASVTYTSPSHDFVGVLVGRTSGGMIEGCTVDGEIEAPSSSHVGGLVGYVDGTAIELCSASVDVSGKLYVGGLIGGLSGSSSVRESYAVGNISGSYEYDKANIGGLIGVVNTYSATIRDCYALGTIEETATSFGGVGGLFGAVTASSNGSDISNSYFQGTVITNGTSDFGGILGDIFNGDTLSHVANMYYHATLPDSGTPTAVGISRTAEEMRTSGNFDGWDFSDDGVWKISDSSFPYLKNNEQDPHPPLL